MRTYPHPSARFGVCTYEGPPGHKRLVRCANPRACTLDYEGPPGQERKVRCYIAPLEKTIHFEGERGDERQAWVEYNDGDIHYVRQGPYPGLARKVLIVSPCRGHTTFLKGEFKMERVVARVIGSGANSEKLAFDGPRGQERRVRRTLPNGTVYHYEGERGHEQITHALLPCGRRVGRIRLLWMAARACVLKANIVHFWQSETQRRLCAADGAGRRADLASFEAQFGS